MTNAALHWDCSICFFIFIFEKQRLKPLCCSEAALSEKMTHLPKHSPRYALQLKEAHSPANTSELSLVVNIKTKEKQRGRK